MSRVKNFSRACGYQFRKLLTGYGFYVCVLLIAVMYLAEAVYADNLTGKSYSMFEAMFAFSWKEMLSRTELCTVRLMQNTTWISQFLFAAAAFVFVPLYSEEAESGNIRYAVSRSDKKSFFAARYICACLGSGLAVCVGYLITLGLIWLSFPSPNYFAGEYREQLLMMLPAGSNFVTCHLIDMVQLFLYGISAGVLAAVCSIWIRNKYLGICIPLFLGYGFTRVCIGLSLKAYEDFEHINYGLANGMAVISPTALLQVFGTSQMKWQILLFHGGMAAAGLFVYVIVQDRRFDCGE